MFKKFAIVAVLTVFSANFAMAQTSGSQKFRVVVPTSISITAPNEVEINHDESDNDQSFDPQQWIVKANVTQGVNVSFATTTPFTHTTLPQFKRDARLGLSTASSIGPAEWEVTQETDQTDYANDDGVALVTAVSNGVGRATFNLAVQFITDDYGTFAAGTYESTVVGTVSAN